MKAANIDIVLNATSHITTARRVCEGGYRLDAGFYSDTAERARLAMETSGWPSRPLGEVARVFALSDFSLLRIPAHESCGTPFFTCSDILEWAPQPCMFLSNKYESNLTDYIVQEGWILLSRSGSVGNTYLVANGLAGKAVANHAIRIVPQNPDIGALIYLVLSGRVGQEVLEAMTYGSVVREIRPGQIEHIRIPMPPGHVLEALRNRIDESVQARKQAVKLRQGAIDAVLRKNDLDPLTVEVPTTEQEPVSPQVFRTKARLVAGNCDAGSEYRLDAHFYNQAALLAVRNIQHCQSEVKTIRELSTQVLMGPRFKRSYVESTHGVPFLSGRNIVQVRPGDLKYLSNLQMTDMQELVLKRGWTLITCSGTIGRTCFVWKNYEDYAASQHILRVMPKESEVDPGYLYAFLASPYGYEQILRYRHGSVIDEVTDKQIENVIVPCPKRRDQEAIGDEVREAYEKRADATRLEDEAQAILLNEITKAQKAKGA